MNLHCFHMKWDGGGQLFTQKMKACGPGKGDNTYYAVLEEVAMLICVSITLAKRKEKSRNRQTNLKQGDKSIVAP